MVLLLRWLLRLFTGLVVLALIAGFLAYYVLSRSLPDYNEDFTESGISAPVEILRNNSDVPHIFGTDDADVYFALGFAHAQDRLWQMTMLRRTAQGKLSEIFGPRTVKIDELMRRLDLYTLSQSSVAAQDAQIGQVIYGSAKAGVNGLVLPMARDLMDLGIRVNSIMPGVFGTPLLGNMNPKVKESLEASVPFPKRLGKAEEYASLAMEMIRNTYFNGQAVRLDGAIRMAPR